MGRKSTVNEFLGKKIGGIVIKEKLDITDGRLFVNCECLSCKKMFRASFHNVYRGKYKSCGCLQHAYNCKNPKWRGVGEISQSFVYAIKRGAKERKLRFNIPIKYLWELFQQQSRKCALSGLELRFQTTRKDYDATASLDRIDSSKGYIKGNVQWVHKNINYMKQEMTNEEFFHWIELIHKHNNE